MNRYEKEKKYLSDIGINIPDTTQRDLFVALNTERDIDNGGIKLFVAPSTLPERVLDVLELSHNYFEGKNVIDIGGGFGGMPFLLEKYANQYIICDPCFDDQQKEKSLEISIYQREKRLKESNTFLKKNELELSTMNFSKPGSQFEYYDKKDFIDTIKSSLYVKEKILSYILQWNNFKSNDYENLIINGSKGENIIGVADNSQDIVMIYHVLNKNYLSAAGILAEASRILKPGGEIFAVDDNDERIHKVIEDLGIEGNIVGNKCVIKIKKS